jgi:tetratricopeptide (TPR) repeat protein
MTELASSPQTAEVEGQQLFVQEKYYEAAEQFTLAQGAYADEGDELRAAEMLNNAGVAYRRCRKHKDAAEALEGAAVLFARLGDEPREAQVLGNLGGLYSKMKRYDRAEECFQSAIGRFQELDDRARQSETLRAMAIMRFKRGRRSEALATYEDALYFLPHPNFLQRVARLLLRIRGLILRFSPTK